MTSARKQRGIEARRLVFLDETWIETNMAPLRGGHRVANAYVPRSRTGIGKP